MGTLVSLLFRSPSSQHDCRNFDTKCPICKELLQKLECYTVNYRFYNTRYLNWMKACLVLQYAKEGLEEFAEEIVKDMHKDIADTVTNTLGRDTVCSTCKIDNTNPAPKCPVEVCNTWVNCIGQYVRDGARLNWGNTSIQSVKEKPWEMAKLFLRDGCAHYNGPKDSDIPALVSLMINCTKFSAESLHKAKLSEVELFHKQLLHSESLTCGEKTLEKNIDSVLYVLKEIPLLRNKVIRKEVVKQIEKIQYNNIIPGIEEEEAIFSRHFSVLRESLNALQIQLDKAVSLKDYKRIQRETQKIEDTGHRFRSFIDMHLMHAPEVRLAFCEVINESREVNLQADRELERQKITPGKPFVVHNNLDSLHMSWAEPSQLFDNRTYEFLSHDISEGTTKSTLCKENSVVLENTRGNATFTFNVRMVSGNEVGPCSVMSDVVRTVMPAGLRMLETAQIYKHGIPDVYTVPLIEDEAFRNTDAKLRKFTIGAPNNCQDEKRVLLLGDSGQSKSLFVDGILNFVLGTNWDDHYRLTVKEENTLKRQEQLEYISEYTIYPDNGSRIGHTVSVTDIPSFGSGLERDEEIVRQLHEFFKANGENRHSSIDVICMHLNINDLKFTIMQKYITEKILSVFGQELSNNFCFLVTGTNEQIGLRIAKELRVPVKRCFVFNNDVLFADKTTAATSLESLWKKDMNVYRDFLQVVGQSESRTFKMSKEVLDARQQLKETASVLETKIRECLLKEVALEHETEKAFKYKEEVELYKHYKYDTEETHYIQTEQDIFVETHCINCNYRCHERCTYEDDEETIYCSAFDGDGFCEVCPGGCSWRQHKRNKREEPKFVQVKEIIQKVDEEKQKRYLKAVARHHHTNATCESHRKAVEDIRKEIKHLKAEIGRINSLLTEIALHPSVMSVADYIDLWTATAKLSMNRRSVEGIEYHHRFKLMAEKLKFNM